MSKLIPLQKKANSAGGNPISRLRIIVISNIVLEPFLEAPLEAIFQADPVSLEVVFVQYEEYRGHILEADIIIVWINFEEIFPEFYCNSLLDEKFADSALKRYQEIMDDLMIYLDNTGGYTIYVGVEDYYHQLDSVAGDFRYPFEVTDILNRYLSTIQSNKSFFMDLKKLIARVGLLNAYSLKNKFRWKCPYSRMLLENFSSQVHRVYEIIFGQSKKCIILDCDNVLWGGVVSEQGLSGIALGDDAQGRMYKEFQRYLLSLHYMGIILAVCSKNYLNDVLEVFDHHRDMILKRKHISCFAVNWKAKSTNIRQIAEELRLSEDSLLFIDDSAFEVEEVKHTIPELSSIQFNGVLIYQNIKEISLATFNEKDIIAKRIQTYKQDAVRREEREHAPTHEEYLKSLEIVIQISKCKADEWGRIAELSMRANRCTNGRRYALADIKQQLEKNDFILYTVRISDRIGDLGLVGAIGLSDQIIELFLLSCRALGRNAELEMMDYIKKNHQVKGFYFAETGKNGELKELLEAGGFHEN